MGWYVASEWVIRIVMIPLVAYRRRLTSALSWLAVIFFLPWPGALGYLLFAEHRLTRRVRRHREVLGEFRTPERMAYQEAHVASPRRWGLSAILGPRLGGFELLEGNAVEIMAGDDGAVERIVEAIDGAEEHVHLLYYIIEDDRTGRRVAEAVKRAAGRGVTCRVLADSIGSHRFHSRLAPGLREAGVEVHRVLSLPFLVRRLRPLDLRNHRKLVVVDGRTAFTGSMNLVDFDARSRAERPPWRDVVLRVRGPVVLQLQQVFVEDFRYTVGREPEGEIFPPCRAAGEVPAQVVPSGPTVRIDTLHNLLVASLNEARERVVITTPYLILDEPTRVALKLAALRGVTVEVVVPEHGDSRLVHLASQSYFEELLDAGIRVLQHRDGFLHAKTVTVDDELAVIGSANFDRRSFYLNFELNLLLCGADVVGRVRAIQEEYMASACAVDPERWPERPRLRRRAEDVVRLLSPLL